MGLPLHMWLLSISKIISPGIKVVYDNIFWFWNSSGEFLISESIFPMHSLYLSFDMYLAAFSYFIIIKIILFLINMLLFVTFISLCFPFWYFEISRGYKVWCWCLWVVYWYSVLAYNQSVTSVCHLTVTLRHDTYQSKH